MVAGEGRIRLCFKSSCKSICSPNVESCTSHWKVISPLHHMPQAESVSRTLIPKSLNLGRPSCSRSRALVARGKTLASFEEAQKNQTDWFSRQAFMVSRGGYCAGRVKMSILQYAAFAALWKVGEGFILLPVYTCKIRQTLWPEVRSSPSIVIVTIIVIVIVIILVILLVIVIAYSRPCAVGVLLRTLRFPNKKFSKPPFLATSNLDPRLCCAQRTLAQMLSQVALPKLYLNA